MPSMTLVAEMPLGQGLFPLRARASRPQAPVGQVPYMEIRSLIPQGFSWFAMPANNHTGPQGVHRNVPIPGTFFQQDFNDGVQVLGKTLAIHKDDLIHHFRWINIIKPFINSIEGFRFLVDIHWIDAKYNKGLALVSETAKNLVQKLHMIKYLPMGNTRSLVDINEEYKDSVLSRETVLRAGTKYVTTSLWQPPLFPEDRARWASEIEARKLVKSRAPTRRPH